MPNPIIPDRVYDPLANSQYTGSGQLVDRLTGMPISVAPAADPLIAQPQQQQPGMQGVDGLLDGYGGDLGIEFPPAQ